jgi:AraC-like DNA-binding protein
MPTHTHAIDPVALATFDLSQTTDHGPSDGTSRVIERVAQPRTVYRYQLQDRALWRTKFKAPAFTLAARSAGSIVATVAQSRYATEVGIEGEESGFFCFTTVLRGETTLTRHGHETIGTGDCGLAFRPGPATRLLMGDGSVRSNIFLSAAEVVDALEHALDQHLSRPLEFRPDLGWGSGLGVTLKGQLDLLTSELQRSDGVANNPLALASMTDLLIALVLGGALHNYTHQLGRDPAGAVPAYLRRAKEFMCAHATEPLRMEQVAIAAGCSVRTLNAVFRSFRGNTPLQALHAIRLEQARRELTRGDSDDSVAAVSRRYVFTNAWRFRADFCRLFGVPPSETVRRAAIR